MTAVPLLSSTRDRGLGMINLARLAPGDAARLADVVLTLGRHGVLVVGRRGPYLVLGLSDRAPRALAIALRRSFTDLGPTFVKFGQLIASSPGLFPDVLSSEMRRLLDRVPPERPGRVHSLLRHELGRPVAEIFADFEDEPVAAASIAQVHRARLHDGRVVAVKVRRPRLRQRIERDVRLLRILALLVERAGAIGELANPVAIVDDFAQGLRSEVDFRNEAEAMVTFERNLRSSHDNLGVVVPTPIEDLVTPRVLVMSFVEGVPVDRLVEEHHGHLDWEDLLRRGVRAWIHGALEFGLFHGDVHAGNLFVTPDGDLAFLDFGIMGTLPTSARDTLRGTLPAVLLQNDYSQVVRALFELGAATRPVDVGQATTDVEALVTPLLTTTLSDISFGEILSQVLRVATRHRVRLPREMVLLVKQLLYFERYAKELAPNYKILADPEILRFLVPTVSPS